MELSDVREEQEPECSLLNGKAVSCYSGEVLSSCIFINLWTNKAHFLDGLQFGFDLC